jgi:phosphatidylserine synthase
MKKAIFRFLGIICAITFFSQFSATRVDSLAPVFIGIAAMIGAIICFSVSDDLHEERGADEDAN